MCNWDTQKYSSFTPFTAYCCAAYDCNQCLTIVSDSHVRKRRWVHFCFLSFCHFSFSWFFSLHLFPLIAFSYCIENLLARCRKRFVFVCVILPFERTIDLWMKPKVFILIQLFGESNACLELNCFEQMLFCERRMPVAECMANKHWMDVCFEICKITCWWASK